jgi:phosphoglycolate phosphatase
MSRPRLDTLIFDLDGTLIDSSASILAGFAAALDDLKIAPKLPLTATVIGPPLHETLANLTGSSDAGLIDSLTSSFKNYYDTEGYKATTVFSGVDEMLKQMHAAGAALHIATNKRLLPTHLILKHLGWGDYSLPSMRLMPALRHSPARRP